MTAISRTFPPRREGWTAAAAYGCTAPSCGTQDTVTADGIYGRRCAAHAPRFDANVAVHLALTDPAAAMAYVRNGPEL